MGLSASQATLLSLTARLTDNEMRSQFITNSKMRLATDSSEASQEYMNALNATQLMYSTYDANGDVAYQKMTPGLVMAYGELKNQYGLTNTSDQLLVSAADKSNFESSKTLSEFLGKYGVELTDNPKYAESLTTLYGANYSKFHDEDNVMGLYDSIDDPTSELLNVIGKYNSDTNMWSPNYDLFDDEGAPIGMTQELFDKFLVGTNGTSGITAWANSLDFGDTKPEGVFGNWIKTLSNFPQINMGIKPDEMDSKYWSKMNTDEGDALYNKFDLASKPCYQAAQGGNSGCYVHVLAHLLDLDYEKIKNNTGYTNTYQTSVAGTNISFYSGINDNHDGEIAYSSIYSYNLTESMMAVSKAICNENTDNGKVLYASENNMDLSNLTNKAQTLLSNYVLDAQGQPVLNSDGEKELKTIKQKAVDLMYVIENYTTDTDLGLQGQYEYLKQFLTGFEEDMKLAFQVEVFDESKYNEDLSDWKTSVEELFVWLNKNEQLKQSFKSNLENIPDEKIFDKNDPKCSWYTNLWYRMGGVSETSKAKDSANKYAELDENLMNNANWLQFALEQGVVTMEQVAFEEKGSTQYPGLGTTDWKSCTYSSLGDITSQDNELAVTKAEVRYQNAVREIQTKDKRHDMDLKKLDTEHTALQTEYDSVKGVIDKNIERSFKAFS